MMHFPQEAFRRRVLLPVGLSLLLLTGCGAKRYPVDAAYCGPADHPSTLPPEAAGLTLYLPRVAGPQDRLWYATDTHRWVLVRPPADLVREALVQGLSAQGLHITDNPQDARGRLEARIRWFAPYGHSPFTAGIIVSLSLHAEPEAKAIWWGRIRSGRVKARSGVFLDGGRRKLQGVLSEVMTEAVRQLRWKPEFRHALTLLATKQE